MERRGSRCCMKTGGFGGGNTATGLNFETERDLLAAIAHAPGYTVAGSVIYYRGSEVARSYKKNALYRMLAERGVDYRQHLSKKLLPDDAISVIVNNKMFIIELKLQQIAGSVDEKLHTCFFKKKQNRKLLAPLNSKSSILHTQRLVQKARIQGRAGLRYFRRMSILLSLSSLAKT